MNSPSSPAGTSKLLIKVTLMARVVLPLRSQPWVDRLGLQRENREDALVHPPQRLAAGDPVEGFQAESVLTQRQRALVCQSALAQPGQVRRLGVVRPVDDAQVLTAAHLKARLPKPFGPADQVRGWLEDRK